jgi:hypothetical protein
MLFKRKKKNRDREEYPLYTIKNPPVFQSIDNNDTLLTIYDVVNGDNGTVILLGLYNDGKSLNMRIDMVSLLEINKTLTEFIERKIMSNIKCTCAIIAKAEEEANKVGAICGCICPVHGVK